jgi:predicted nucleotide-binding protein (sugar kinase/HSP70/actin superfamily)
MGAYGAALIARDQWRALNDPGARSSLVTPAQLKTFNVALDLKRCGGCSNNCLLTINTFHDGAGSRKFVTGNRCERGLEVGLSKTLPRKDPLPNLFAEKYKRLFSYRPLPAAKAPRGIVGIPRVLNIYENYPLWFTLFTKLGFCVQLSPRSSRRIYEYGLESIPSESVCYPGKIAHGHIEALLKAGVKFIFYPCAPMELKEDPTAGSHFNCPIVSSYPEVIRNNIDAMRQDASIMFMDPFLPIDSKKRLGERLADELCAPFGLSRCEVLAASDAAWDEQERFRRDVRQMGVSALEEIKKRNLRAVVLAGRPYHIDPAINHGIPELITSLGLGVLTEDSVAHLGTVERPLRVVDQWVYHNRLYRAAIFIAGQKNIEFVQLTSFGCGLDAVTSDQIEEILQAKGRMYTLIKIDEGSNLGAVRIRLRSLIAAMDERRRRAHPVVIQSSAFPKKIFTAQMKKDRWTVLAPQMAPLHFRLLRESVRHCGYNLDFLPEVDPDCADTGLRFVNNDACYPSIIVVGQMMNALKSGKYDPDRTALLMTQTGGGCRATNYIGFIRRALRDNGLSHVPVIGLSVQGFERAPGFTPDFVFVHRLVMGLINGDVLMRCLYRTRPYELILGSADALCRKYVGLMSAQQKSLRLWPYFRLQQRCIDEFDRLPLRPDVRKPRVGVVGEILVKFHPIANNDIVKVIEAEGAEAVVPDLGDFFMYCVSHGACKHNVLSEPVYVKWTAYALVRALEIYRWGMKRAFARSVRFTPPRSIWHTQKSLEDIVQLGNMMGEGWLLTGEMIELIRSGVPNIACIQPFACLPNHVTGKGMIKELRRRFPEANIAAIDYDPGASEVNQLNRLKLLLANARPGTHPDETKRVKSQ